MKKANVAEEMKKGQGELKLNKITAKFQGG